MVEDHDLHVGERLQHLPGRGDAVEIRHADVHDDDVGLEQPGSVGGLAPVVSLPDELDSLVTREHTAQTGAHQRVVVDDQHPHSRGHAGLPENGNRACSWKRPFAGPRIEAAAEQRCAFAHADDPVPATGRGIRPLAW